MKIYRIYLLPLLLFMLIDVAYSQELIIKKSENNQKETIAKLKSEMKGKNLNVIQHVKHSEAANKANMELSPSDVIIFGNPEVGTKLMQADPRVAIELPLRILVWEENGITNVAYQDPNRLLESFQLGEHREVLAKMRQVLDDITNEAIRR
jgi:uncharacterized protein (DUF302 family)